VPKEHRRCLDGDRKISTRIVNEVELGRYTEISPIYCRDRYYRYRIAIGILDIGFFYISISYSDNQNIGNFRYFIILFPTV